MGCEAHAWPLPGSQCLAHHQRAMQHVYAELSAFPAQEGTSWQATLRALCALEAVVQQGPLPLVGKQPSSSRFALCDPDRSRTRGPTDNGMSTLSSSRAQTVRALLCLIPH